MARSSSGATTLPDVPPDLGRGRRLLFLHAAGSNGHNWHRQIDHFGRALANVVDDARLNHRIAVTKGVLEAECSAVLKDFFARRR